RPLRLLLRADLRDHPHRPLLQLQRVPPRWISWHDSKPPKLRSLRTCRGDSLLAIGAGQAGLGPAVRPCEASVKVPPSRPPGAVAVAVPPGHSSKVDSTLCVPVNLATDWLPMFHEPEP